MKGNLITFLLIIIVLIVACDEQKYSALLVVTGKIIELSEDVYGIDGVTKEVGKYISNSKNVKYKISWLPDAVKDKILHSPDTEFRYFYRILENGNDQDWSTTIEIVTD